MSFIGGKTGKLGDFETTGNFFRLCAAQFAIGSRKISSEPPSELRNYAGKSLKWWVQ
jgi:hypothetical protein